MRLVIDTNMVMAALIKDSKAREVILHPEFEFSSPDFVLEEIGKYKKYILEKSELNEEAFELLIQLIFQQITIIPKEEYMRYCDQAKQVMQQDLKDVPYVACYIALQCDGIWTNDSDYFNKNELKIFSTLDLLKLINK